ncbi:MAG: ATP-NAD kinase [Haloarculaceae archaeon]
MTAPPSGPVGLVGDAGATVRDAVSALDREAVVGDPDAVLGAEPALVVARGERALSALVADGVPAPPVLAVDAGPGVPSVPDGDVAEALDRAVAGDADATALPVLVASVDGTVRSHALFEWFLVTAEPAQISEFSVRAGGSEVSRVRADGLVVATPAGSHGYAHRVDGPRVARGTGVVAVVPVAPFTTDADRWVVPAESVRLRVERDEAPVTLRADVRETGPVEAGQRVTISPAGSLSLLTPPTRRSTDT